MTAAHSHHPTPAFLFSFYVSPRAIGPLVLQQTKNGSYVLEGYIVQALETPEYPANLTVNHTRYYPEADNHALDGTDAVVWSFKSCETYPDGERLCRASTPVLTQCRSQT